MIQLRSIGAELSIDELYNGLFDAEASPER